MAVEKPAQGTVVGSFGEAFKLTNRREVTIDVFVRLHAPTEEDERDFDRRVRESLKRQTDRRYLV